MLLQQGRQDRAAALKIAARNRDLCDHHCDSGLRLHESRRKALRYAPRALEIVGASQQHGLIIIGDRHLRRLRKNCVYFLCRLGVLLQIDHDLHSADFQRKRSGENV